MSTFDDVLARYQRSIPKVMNPQTNQVLNALLRGFAGMDADIADNIQNTKAQLFVRTAEGVYLDRLANSLGVSRPQGLGLQDPQFQELIPNLSLKAKTIRKTFYDVANIFWEPLFVHSNVQTANFAPFNVSPGDVFKIIVDDGKPQTVKALTGDIASPGNATAVEIVNLLSRINGITATIIQDPLSSNEAVNIMTTTPGPSGSITVLSSTMVGSSKLNFPLARALLLQQSQRVCIYEIRPNEMVIELPAIIPALRRTLKGSAHLHADATLSTPVPPSGGVWRGSFLFDPAGTAGSFTISGQNCTSLQDLVKGNVYTSLTVDSTAKIVEQSGYLIFGFGTPNQEQPVRFRGIPNSNTILLDPSYVFKNNQPSGTAVNVLTALTPYTPRPSGDDYAVYLTSPSDARAVTQTILSSLAAAGVIVTFVVLLPSYRYLITNPYAG